MNANFFGPHIEAEAHLDAKGCLDKLVVHHPHHAGRCIEIPGCWIEGVPCDASKIVAAVSESLNGAQVRLIS